jgi:hypothetical protein
LELPGRMTEAKLRLNRLLVVAYCLHCLSIRPRVCNDGGVLFGVPTLGPACAPKNNLWSVFYE